MKYQGKSAREIKSTGDPPAPRTIALDSAKRLKSESRRNIEHTTTCNFAIEGSDGSDGFE